MPGKSGHDGELWVNATETRFVKLLLRQRRDLQWA